MQALAPINKTSTTETESTTAGALSSVSSVSSVDSREPSNNCSLSTQAASAPVVLKKT